MEATAISSPTWTSAMTRVSPDARTTVSEPAKQEEEEEGEEEGGVTLAAVALTGLVNDFPASLWTTMHFEERPSVLLLAGTCATKDKALEQVD